MKILWLSGPWKSCNTRSTWMHHQCLKPLAANEPFSTNHNSRSWIERILGKVPLIKAISYVPEVLSACRTIRHSRSVSVIYEVVLHFVVWSRHRRLKCYTCYGTWRTWGSKKKIEEDYEKATRTKTDQLCNFPAPWGEFGARFTQSFATLKRSRDFCLAKGWMRQQSFGTWTKRWMLVNVELVSFPTDLLLNRSFRKALVFSMVYPVPPMETCSMSITQL